MRERIDAERRVVDGDRAPEEADDEPLQAGGGITGRRQNEGRGLFVPMQPHQFGISGEVADLAEVGRLVTAVENPSEMTVKEAALNGRVHVLGHVGIEMVLTVFRRPPEDAFLRRALGKRRQNELERAAGLVGAVREVAMVAGADGENAQPVKPDADGGGLPSDPGPDRAEAGEMHQHERNGGRIDDVRRRGQGFGGVRGGMKALVHGLLSEAARRAKHTRVRVRGKCAS